MKDKTCNGIRENLARTLLRKSSLEEALKLYVVTDNQWSTKAHPLLASVEETLQGGATMIQVREKHLSTPDFIAEAGPIVGLCHAYGVPCIINDNLEVALATGADGLHIGQDDGNIAAIRHVLGPHKILGVSAQTVEEAMEAQLEGADYLGVGHVFPTATKKDSIPVSIDTLEAIIDSVDIPVVAIGGINGKNVSRLKNRGLAGIALVSAILGSPHITEVTRDFAQALGDLSNPFPPVLTIAGSDASGGAGIQADLKTIHANGGYGMSVITAVTAQNTSGVDHIEVMSLESISKQISSILRDIPPKAIKIGMLANESTIQSVSKDLQGLSGIPVVLDPVMVATSGAPLLEASAIKCLEETLIPQASLITPNIPEAQLLSHQSIENRQDMERVARQLGRQYACAVLLKGGHGKEEAHDYLWMPEGGHWIEGKRLDNPNTHGTGCTLSSAIAVYLAKGYTLIDAVMAAKTYLTSILRKQLNLGVGSGPMKH